VRAVARYRFSAGVAVMPWKRPKVTLRRASRPRGIETGARRTPLNAALMELAAKVRNASGEIEAIQNQAVHEVRLGRENVEQNLSSVREMMSEGQTEMRTTAEDLKLILFDEMREMGLWTEDEIEECRRAYLRLEESGVAAGRMIDGDPLGAVDAIAIAIEAHERLDALFTSKRPFAAQAEPAAVSDFSERLVSLLWSTWALHTTVASSGNLTEEDVDLSSPVSPEAFWGPVERPHAPSEGPISGSSWPVSGDGAGGPTDSYAGLKEENEEVISTNPPPFAPSSYEDWLRTLGGEPISEWMKAITIEHLAMISSQAQSLVSEYRSFLSRNPGITWVQHRDLLRRRYGLREETIVDLERMADDNARAGLVPGGQVGDDHAVDLVGDWESVKRGLTRFRKRIFSFDLRAGNILDSALRMLTDKANTHGWMYVATNVMMTPVWWMLLYGFLPISTVLSWTADTSSVIDGRQQMERIEQALSTEHCVVTAQGRNVCGVELEQLLDQAISNMTCVHDELGGQLAGITEVGLLFDKIIPSLQTSIKKMNGLVEGLRALVSGKFHPHLLDDMAVTRDGLFDACSPKCMADGLCHLPKTREMSDACRGFINCARSIMADQMKAGYHRELQQTVGDVQRAAAVLQRVGSDLGSWTAEAQQKISEATKVFLQMVPLDFKKIAKGLGMHERTSRAYVNELIRRAGARAGMEITYGIAYGRPFEIGSFIKPNLLTRLPHEQYEMFTHSMYESCWSAAINVAAEAKYYDWFQRIFSGGLLGKVKKLAEGVFVDMMRRYMPGFYRFMVGAVSGGLGATFGQSLRLARNLRILLNPLSPVSLSVAEARAGMGREQALRELFTLMKDNATPMLGTLNVIRDATTRIPALGGPAGRMITVHLRRPGSLPTREQAAVATGDNRRANSLIRGIAYCSSIFRAAAILRRAGMRTAYDRELSYTAAWSNHWFDNYGVSPENLPISGYVERISAEFVAGAISSVVSAGRVPLDILSLTLWPFGLFHVMNALHQTVLTVTSASWAYGIVSLAGLGYTVWAQPHDKPRQNTRPLLGYISSTVMPDADPIKLGGGGMGWYALRSLGVFAVTAAIMYYFPNTVFDVGLPFSGIESAIKGMEDFSASAPPQDWIMEKIAGMSTDPVWRIIWDGAIPGGLQAFVALGGPCFFFPFWNHLQGTVMGIVFGAFAKSIGWSGQTAGLLAAMFFYGLNVGAQLHVVLPELRGWVRRGGVRRVVWGTVTPIARAFRTGIGRLFGADAASSEALQDDMTILGLLLLSKMYEEVFPDASIEAGSALEGFPSVRYL
jgi:hypothetical protein